MHLFLINYVEVHGFYQHLPERIDAQSNWLKSLIRNQFCFSYK